MTRRQSPPGIYKILHIPTPISVKTILYLALRYAAFHPVRSSHTSTASLFLSLRNLNHRTSFYGSQGEVSLR